MIQTPVFPKPDCNAVKIEINNPTVSAQTMACPNCQQAAQPQPQPYYYAYPQASVYSQGMATQVPMQQQFVPVQPQFVPIQSQVVPAQSVNTVSTTTAMNALPPADTNSYIQTSETTTVTPEPVKTTQTVTTTKTEATAVPTGFVATIPVYQTFPGENGELKLQSVPQPTITEQAEKKNVVVDTVVTPATTVTEKTTVTETTTTTAQNGEVKTETQSQTIVTKPDIVEAEAIAPKINIDKYCNSLDTEDFRAQFEAMKSIKDMVNKYPEDATATSLVDTRVYDSLYKIVSFDSSKLKGPSKEQIAAREKINKGMKVSKEERAIAEALSPKEYAEHNKSIAMYTMASLDKLMIDVLKEDEKMSIPLSDIPYVNAISDEAKDNPNPIVRASAIEALSWIQQPEYKNEFKALFTAATKDKDPHVSETAKNALDKLNKMQ